MNIEETKLKGVYVCTPKVHHDDRGFFFESYNQKVFTEAGISDIFVQDNHAFSLKKNTVRGLNFQWQPPVAKVMRVTRGEVFLVAVDIRKNSPTLGQWVGVVANEENKKELYAPAGFARGYQTLTDNCDVLYKFSSHYNPEGVGEVRWDDPEIAIDWPIKDSPIILDRSKEAKTLKQWLATPASEELMI